ncbi:restriction endonuclease subunit S [Leptospira andrefontaineae]|uniref:Restriction endonuclease subunit S n=1 Tax=Leptospira andrefontaineae TaxID=2484976 RepID=A0A4R9H8U4_9LEPT|nr:restriction endonuclease subunit S [Leptospira andrefontaineae]TGK42472.1 restriction endonuclease subunit S [Leptospira andrefontaineae]
MNPLLQTHFDTALEHPNGIKKLRELILTLAMQGKLVEQDPNDPPTSELLQEIQAEKARLVEEGKIKKSEALPPVKEEEKPFVIPKGWEWVNVPDSFYSVGTKSNQIANSDYLDQGKYPIVDQGKSLIGGYSDDESKLIKIERPIIIFGDHTKNLKYIDFDFIIGADGVKTLCPKRFFEPRFFYHSLKSLDLNDRGYARHFKVLNSKILPLPPLAEQKRIVEKIDELFALCDELERLKLSKDAKRKDLHQSVLTQILEADSHADFQRHFQFLNNHFQELYRVKENVKELRKAVLQLAVMGKLVPQDPNDQPASELLKEIQAEQARLVAEGKIKKSEALPPVKEEEKPFAIPKGWEWVRLGEVLQKYGAGSTPLGGKSVYTSDGIMFLRSQNVWNDGLYLDDVARIAKVIHEKMKGTKVIGNDILLNITGASIGRSTIFPLNFEEANVSQHVAILRTFTPSIVVYLHKLIISDFFQNLVFKEQVGVSREGLSMAKLSKFPISLPPLAEQKRIVEKVDQLLALCDELEKGLEKAEEKGGEILEGIVRVKFKTHPKSLNSVIVTSLRQDLL